ncbi:MAG: hypothetical protein K9M49_05360 [Candidatus Marinimicrobia bacterium]|nr:hypothetical protein [Candidatus Neomarinimicrobiota bacterium]MCF7850433.1 hypothetical protein [Candidatus Neomarinimicrobiota bacterium]MCF7904565.1 hypothetical protein [Candidatus Neomarinimicrobiota bacterium]
MSQDFMQSPEFQALIKEYLEYLKALFPETRQHFENAGYDKVYKFAHNIKGTGTSYGFENLSQLGADICSEINAEKYENIPDQLNQIESIIDTALEERSGS